MGEGSALWDPWTWGPEGAPCATIAVFRVQCRNKAMNETCGRTINDVFRNVVVRAKGSKNWGEWFVMESERCCISEKGMKHFGVEKF